MVTAVIKCDEKERDGRELEGLSVKKEKGKRQGRGKGNEKLLKIVMVLAPGSHSILPQVCD